MGNPSTGQPVVYAFIDSQNLNLGVRSEGWRLDFAKFRVYLKDKYNVSKAYLFIGYLQSNNKLYSFLRAVGYTLIFKPTVSFFSQANGRKTIKGNVDAELVLHVMQKLPQFDRAVIVSGDGDFHCLLEYLDSVNKLEVILVPNSRYSSLLKEFGDKIVQVCKLREKLERGR